MTNYKIITPRMTWETNCLNTFTPTDRDIKLYELAKEYEHRCEAYDRQVCSYIDEVTGKGIPTNGYQLKLIGRYSREVLADILIRNPEFKRGDIIKCAAMNNF